jgi:hypothetical protein
LVLKTLRRLSAADPEADYYQYTGGMGSWSFYRKGPVTEDGETYTTERELEDEADPAYSAIIDASSEFGYSVVPDGHYVFKAGKKISKD